MEKNTTISVGLYAICIGIAVVYFGWIYAYALEAPLSEDVLTTFKPVIDFYQATDLRGKYLALVEQCSDHRLMPTRLAAIASIGLFDYLSVRFLYFTGAVLVTLLACLIYFDRRKSSAHHPIELVIILLLMLNPAYRTGTFAGWGISNFASVLFPLLAIMAMCRKGWLAFGVFELLTGLSINTQGNGILMIPVGLVYFALDPAGRDSRRFQCHAALSFFAAVLYVLNFSDSGIGKPVAENFLLDPFGNILFVIAGFFTWIGQWAIVDEDVMYRHPLSGVVIAGLLGLLLAIVSAVMMYRNWRRLFRQYPVRMYLYLYMLGTITGAAIERSLIQSYIKHSNTFSQLSYALDKRFAFYTLVLLVLLLSLALSLRTDAGKPVHQWRMMLVILALVFWLSKFSFALPHMKKERTRDLACIRHWHELQEAKPCMWHGDTGAVMIQAKALGFLRIGDEQDPGRDF